MMLRDTNRELFKFDHFFGKACRAKPPPRTIGGKGNPRPNTEMVTPAAHPSSGSPQSCQNGRPLAQLQEKNF